MNQAAIAVDLLRTHSIEQNDVDDAILDYLNANVMYEAEQNIKNATKSYEDKKKTIHLAEAAAACGVTSDPLAGDTSASQKVLDFDITDINFDISFVPSDDPDVYKPIEIISYMGLTNNL